MGRVVNLFIASTIPVLKVLLVTGLGSLIALDRVNILGDDARKHLNNISFFVFNPALVFNNLAKTITYESLAKLWFMPFNVLSTFVIGSVLGWVIIQITKPPAHLRGLVIGCCAAGNLGNLPLIIVPAVCKEKGSPFGDPDVCHKYGMAYASLSMAIGAIFIWSYVYNIVRISSTSNSSKETMLTQPLLSSDSEIQIALPQNETEHQPKVSEVIKQKVKTLLKNMNLKRLFAPSTIGVIAGFVVGLIPLIRNLLIGDEAPLRVIQDAATLIGDGAIPAVTLIVGANLLKGLKGSEIRKSLIFGVVIVRYVVLPLMGIVIVKGAVRFGFVSKDDPLYQFVLLLQFSLPPAMGIGTITQLFGAGEKECSVIMLWCYMLASVSLTCWSTFYLWLVS